jgi:hypothetical protein
VLLFRFPVGTMAAAEAAIFRKFQAIRVVLLVFLRVVIPALAFLTRQDDHHSVLFFCHFVP